MSDDKKASAVQRVKVRIPGCWKHLVGVEIAGLEDVTSEKHCTGIDDPNPHYDDARRVTGVFPDGANFSLELCSGQNNYYGGVNIEANGREVCSLVLDGFEDEPGSNTLTAVVTNPPVTYIFEIEWTLPRDFTFDPGGAILGEDDQVEQWVERVRNAAQTQGVTPDEVYDRVMDVFLKGFADHQELKPETAAGIRSTYKGLLAARKPLGLALRVLITDLRDICVSGEVGRHCSVRVPAVVLNELHLLRRRYEELRAKEDSGNEDEFFDQDDEWDEWHQRCRYLIGLAKIPELEPD